jgi:hypothetical protein
MPLMALLSRLSKISGSINVSRQTAALITSFVGKDHLFHCSRLKFPFSPSRKRAPSDPFFEPLVSSVEYRHDFSQPLAQPALHASHRDPSRAGTKLSEPPFDANHVMAVIDDASQDVSRCGEKCEIR